jgi:hypothetical protein
MQRKDNAGSRILAAHARHSADMAAEYEAARAAGAPAAELAELEARALAARRMFQELNADLSQRQKTARPWWRFLGNSRNDND